MLRFVKGLFQPITLVLIFLLPLKNSKAATFAASVDQAPLLRSKRWKKSFLNPFISLRSIQIKGLGFTSVLPIWFNKVPPVSKPPSNISSFIYTSPVFVSSQ